MEDLPAVPLLSFHADPGYVETVDSGKRGYVVCQGLILIGVCVSPSLVTMEILAPKTEGQSNIFSFTF